MGDSETLCRIECWLRELAEQGFGDPLDSITETKSLSDKYTLIVSAPRVSVLILENTGAIDIFWALDKNAPIPGGKKLSASGGRLIIDRFRGSLFARGTTAGATIEYALLTWMRPMGVGI